MARSTIIARVPGAPLKIVGASFKRPADEKNPAKESPWRDFLAGAH